MPRDDWELAHAARAGDHAAFAELYRRHQPVILQYLRRRLGDDDTAEDLASETFARAWTALDSLRHERSTVQAWLQTIARHLLYDFGKAAARREQPVAEFFELPEPAESPEARLLAIEERRTRTRAVRRALRHLTDEQRHCLALRYWQELSVRETAAQLCRSDAATRQLQHRATRRLADLI